tara:strand:- start:6707 stop:7456 length:750 start_codon:yes stop_codon:yes gene_type:complete
MIRLNRKIIPDLAKFIEMRYDVKIHDNKHPEIMKSFLRLQYWLNEEILARYFQYNDEGKEEGVYWKQQLQFDTRKTGQRLKDKLQKMIDENPDTKILDLGCGDNDWKDRLGDNVFGVDPYNEKADANVHMRNIVKNDGKWDVVLCLGSINFGDEESIKADLAKAVHLCKPKGTLIFRLNPGITHDTQYAKWVDFFEWDEDKIKEYADHLKCDIVEMDWDHEENGQSIRWGNRHYVEWRKRGGLRGVEKV